MKKLCNHLYGENHTKQHRMWTGLVIMFIGVLISKSFVDINGILHIFGDTVGYGVHAFGATPFIEHLMKVGNGQN